MLHLNIRAVCDEGRGRLCLERFDEFFAVHFWAPVRQMTYIVRTNLAPGGVSKLITQSALKITRSLCGSADPTSKGDAAARIWPGLRYRAGTRRIPVRAPT